MIPDYANPKASNNNETSSTRILQCDDSHKDWMMGSKLPSLILHLLDHVSQSLTHRFSCLQSSDETHQDCLSNVLSPSRYRDGILQRTFELCACLFGREDDDQDVFGDDFLLRPLLAEDFTRLAFEVALRLPRH